MPRRHRAGRKASHIRGLRLTPTNGDRVRGSRRFRSALLFLAVALLAALIGDWTIEGSATIGLFGRSYALDDQRSVICTAAVVFGLIVLCVLTSVLEKFAILRSDGDWIKHAARDISSRWSWSTLGASYGVSLAARYAMESARQIEQSGHLARGWGWFGAPISVALIIHAALCVLAYLGLFAFMRALERTLERVVAFVITIIKIRDICTHDVGRDVDHMLAAIRRRSRSLARHFGERAPPIAHDFRLNF
jgi:hypothetical protein